ncbi:hypothetical protein W59_14151 [Rhodococcus opacus RKJ300 = JCM 13270]|uniref:Uncharacterized protein n=1 Tax=Rhodococcus opacus RKJ300 = JCM 13270 TaxID=1165867 RepID=I0WSC6_RHOOP|nr:hypothetical protein W59_14151 [Rhodococcus opacus RKJ300 = JCM 13270]
MDTNEEAAPGDCGLLDHEDCRHHPGRDGGDLLAQTLDVGYAVSSVLFIALFLVNLITQMKAKKFHPALYWTVIVSTSTAGTTMSDFLNRSAALGYAKGALLLITCLACVFMIWSRCGETFDVEQITTFRGELLDRDLVLQHPRYLARGFSRRQFRSRLHRRGRTDRCADGPDPGGALLHPDLGHRVVLGCVRTHPPARGHCGGPVQQAARQGWSRARHRRVVGCPGCDPAGPDRLHPPASPADRSRAGTGTPTFLTARAPIRV